jgi:(5-formylfuran-3-yl)methyl phosphate synthase
MTRFLASVRSAEEAATALAGGADIIDAKDPISGALGRVAPAVLAAILEEVRGRCPVSATIGDMELAPLAVRGAVQEMAACSVDIVKVGIFDGDVAGTFSALAPLAARGVRLVAVAFADRNHDVAPLVARCAEAGFYGIMLDTAEKSAGPVTAHASLPELVSFTMAARRAGLFTGLAGSLRLADMPALAAVGADYLGFRSALTVGRRVEALDLEAVRAIRSAIDQLSAAPSIATATAGPIAAAVGASSGAESGTSASKLR